MAELRYEWAVGRTSSFRIRLPAREDPAWWDAHEVIAGAEALLRDRRVWVRTVKHDFRAGLRFSRKKPGKKKACEPRHRRVVQWTAMGAMERSGHPSPNGPGVTLALELSRIAARGLPLGLVEETGGRVAVLWVLRRVLRALERLHGVPARKKPATKTSSPQSSGIRWSPDQESSLPCAVAGVSCFFIPVAVGVPELELIKRSASIGMGCRVLGLNDEVLAHALLNASAFAAQAGMRMVVVDLSQGLVRFETGERDVVAHVRVARIWDLAREPERA